MTDFILEEELAESLERLEQAYDAEPLFECISFEKFVSDFANSNDPLAPDARKVQRFLLQD